MGNHELGQKWIALVPNDIKGECHPMIHVQDQKSPQKLPFCKG
jgi:hypothetical protein